MSLIRLVWDVSVALVLLLGVVVVAAVQIVVWLSLWAMGRHRESPIQLASPPTPIQRSRAPRRPSVGAATAKAAANAGSDPSPAQAEQIVAQPVAPGDNAEREGLIVAMMREHRFPRELATTCIDRHLATKAALTA